VILFEATVGVSLHSGPMEETKAEKCISKVSQPFVFPSTVCTQRTKGKLYWTVLPLWITES
jgi:hypothetical protein